MGRKRVIIDWVKLDSYLQLKASLKTCSILLECSHDTIERNIKKQYKMTFSEYAATKFEPVKLKLVQKAIGKAMDGDNTMLIFCLKNLCGWADKVENIQASEVKIIVDDSDQDL